MKKWISDNAVTLILWAVSIGFTVGIYESRVRSLEKNFDELKKDLNDVKTMATDNNGKLDLLLEHFGITNKK